jgi:DNA-binding HxlR family transcriptional regulator
MSMPCGTSCSHASRGCCPAASGDKWTVMIVRVLVERPRRFNDIKRTIGGISQQMLTQTLKAHDRDDGKTDSASHGPATSGICADGTGVLVVGATSRVWAWAEKHLELIDGNRLRYDMAGNVGTGMTAHAATP